MPKKTPRQKFKPVRVIERPVFVEIPPELVDADERPRFTELRESQKRYEEGTYIRIMGDMFKETKDPIPMMEAYVASMNLGVYPPVSMLDALKEAFQTVLESKGKKRLDEVLGLRKAGQGEWTAFTRKQRDGFSYWLASTLHSLTERCELSIEEAARRLSRYLDKHRDEMRFYTVGGLVDAYSRQWQPYRKAFDARHPDRWTPEFRDRFLKTFPDTFDE